MVTRDVLNVKHT